MTETDSSNILLIIADALRHDALSCNGYRRNGRKTTPNIDELAKNSSVYESAIATGPSTNMSQTALTTGKYPSNMDFAGAYTQLGDKTETIAEDIKEENYSTMAIHTAMLSKDEAFGRGFDEYYELGLMPKFKFDKDYITSGLYNLMFGKDSRTRHKNEILKDFIGKESDRPFFSYTCYTNTHNPYRATRKFRKRFERPLEEGMNEELIDYISGPGNANKAVSKFEELSEDELDVIRSRYDASLAYLDYRLGKVFEYLKKKGLYDDTMIIITSDHGELFGEDGLFYHALSIRQELIHVPLIIKYPEQEEGEKIEEPVSLLDISPTILRASGVDLSGKDFDGVPLQEGGTNIPLSELGEPKEERIEDLEEKGVNAEKYNRGAKTAQNKEYKLLKYSDGEEKLIEKSSGQEADKPQVKERLSEEIEEKLSGFWTGGDEIKVEEEVKEELEKLGYF